MVLTECDILCIVKFAYLFILCIHCMCYVIHCCLVSYKDELPHYPRRNSQWKDRTTVLIVPSKFLKNLTTITEQNYDISQLFELENSHKLQKFVNVREYDPGML